MISSGITSPSSNTIPRGADAKYLVAASDVGASLALAYTRAEGKLENELEARECADAKI